MSKPTVSRWSAVSIVPGSGGCEAARALKGQRFLGAAAPRMPLPECTAPQGCRCVYRKYADRRAGPRRAVYHGGNGEWATPGRSDGRGADDAARMYRSRRQVFR